MFKKLIQTDDDVSRLLMRVLLGIVFFPHGAQKLLGWFGGGGFSATMSMFMDKMGIPAVLAFLAIMAESVGAVALIAGFLTRIAALGIATNMTVAIFMVHLPNGFFMNWFGNQKGEGYEYHILAIALAVALIIKGGGKWSIDRLMSKGEG
jgi:putative oxidoreductase